MTEARDMGGQSGETRSHDAGACKWDLLAGAFLAVDESGAMLSVGARGGRFQLAQGAATADLAGGDGAVSSLGARCITRTYRHLDVVL
ncbi:hypothetical protein CFAM422_000161 [Trichoderma lentiforme]|uniref:Uncharacterized protein n=1 Tax=Trichoderma lentiforme TaxID=1567552 RepID=A0A9P4XQH5_9HYPO|nr:hypothetical protein CFAM422_000161 [Trichoderma lentiforme]